MADNRIPVQARRAETHTRSIDNRTAQAVPVQQAIPHAAQASGSHRGFGQRLKRYWWVVLVLVALGLIGFLGKGYLDTKKQLTELNTTTTATQADGQELVSEISKFFVLPEETPTVATINDVSKLQNQEFFKSAQTGDKVLIFPDAGKAMIYRPSTGKVIEYSKVNLNAGADGSVSP